ncbi:hypothetical protein F4553_000072 [Allocatelliglobosispora scoriae]|uniref:Transposase IS4-like domain-containing protein n=1 Tax=Allocatelliglobosispora scoriae TaxID=643052 RepID=A0A841BI08_9ACTN|nr:hypothetical protein [Allocatelliglobosispora scoriae]
MVDAGGLPLVFLLTPGQAADCPQFQTLLDKVRVPGPVGRPRTRPDAVAADKAYSSQANRAYLRRRRIKAVIPEKADQQANRRRKGTGGGRPVAFNPQDYKQEKDRFFALLAERGNVSAVARELGFTRVTCYKWAHQAGIFTSEATRVKPRRERFLQLRAEGLTRAQAAERVGADKRSAADWDKGITIIHRGRVYPDGRVVRYPDPILTDAKPQRKAAAIGGKVDLNRVEKVIHPRYLSLLERERCVTCAEPGRRSGRSPRRWVVHRRRSAASCAATRRPHAGICRTPRTGRLSNDDCDPGRPGSRRIRDCWPTSRRSWPRNGRRSRSATD